MSNTTRCGYVALVGRPNVGKSSLLNCLCGEKLSITSNKPQTTRHLLRGIRTTTDCQMIFIDMPGIHQTERKAINRYMNRAARRGIDDADVLLFVIEADRWTEEDTLIAQQLSHRRAPIFVVLNKIDKLNKADLVTVLPETAARLPDVPLVPISAHTGENKEALLNLITTSLPESVFLYPEDQHSDQNELFFVAELIREKLFNNLYKELPYALTVQIESLKREQGRVYVHALIWIERDSQKPIVIGKGGLVLKRVGQKARLELEKHWKLPVVLKLWVKVKEEWTNNEHTLRQLGFLDI